MPLPLLAKLANRRLPVSTRLRELASWLNREEDDPAVDAYLVSFLDAQLGTGSPEVAHEAGLDAALGRPPPPARVLAGAEDLNAAASDWRSAIELALVAAGRRAPTRPALLTRLFRSLLLWPTHEREVAMDALLSARPAAAEITAGLREVLSELGHVKDQPGERLLPVLQAGLSEPRWMVALCQALRGQEAGERALRQLQHVCLPDPEELFPAPFSEKEEALVALRAVQVAGQKLARALSTLTLAAVPDAVPDEELISLLADESLPDWLREAALSWLLFRGIRSPDLGPLAKQILSGTRHHEFREKLELLHQLATPVPARAPVHTAQVDLIPLTSHIASGPALVGGDAVFLLVRALRRFPAGAWRCAEEEAALGILRPSGDFGMRPLPLRLPSRPTGAAGAERVWGLELLLDGRLVISLRVPFSDERGWGTQNHLLAWDPSGTWWELERSQKGVTMHPLSEPVGDQQLCSWGTGELVVWKDAAGRLCTMNDGTPYHLEEAEPSVQVQRKRAVARKSDRGWTGLSRPEAAVRQDALILTGNRRTFRLDTLGAVLRGLPESAGTAEPLLLGGVLLAEGWLAVGVRSFLREPAPQICDSVARAAVPPGPRKKSGAPGSSLP